jgi:hypothetical protein
VAPVGGFEAVDDRYLALYQRASDVLREDDRILRVTVGGSIANGTADQWSDLDLEIITAPEAHEDVVATWPDWLAVITPTVFARTPIAPFIINAVTDRGLTLDLAVFAGERPDFTPPGGPAYVVGALSSRRFHDVGAALEYAVGEQLRGMAGPFISLVQRDEHVRHLSGVPHLLGLLTTVFLAETGAPPLGKHWNRTLTAEQRDAVAGLPPVRATRDAIVAFGLAIAELTITRARPLYPRYELEWPSAFAAVVAARVEECLGIDTRAWAY